VLADYWNTRKNIVDLYKKYPKEIFKNYKPEEYAERIADQEFHYYRLKQRYATPDSVVYYARYPMDNDIAKESARLYYNIYEAYKDVEGAKDSANKYLELTLSINPYYLNTIYNCYQKERDSTKAYNDTMVCAEFGSFPYFTQPDMGWIQYNFLVADHYIYVI
jgi:hypothetical protein